MKIKDLVVEADIAQSVGKAAFGAGKAVGQVVSSPTAKGIGAGIANTFGSGATRSPVTQPRTSTLQGIDTQALKTGLTKVVNNQQVQPDDIAELKKLLAKLG